MVSRLDSSLAYHWFVVGLGWSNYILKITVWLPIEELILMKYLTAIALLIAFSALAQQEGKRVYQKDSIGNIQYHKQSWIIVKGQMCPVDTIGSRQHHKPCLDIGSKEMDRETKSQRP